MSDNTTTQKQATIFSLLIPYRGLLIGLVVLALLSNALTILIPKLIATSIDHFISGTFDTHHALIIFGAVAVAILILTYAQNIVQVYASERVARDLRKQTMAKISLQNFSYIQSANPSVLLTNLTSDIDGIKNFVAQAIVSIISSFFIIIGVSVMLILLDWKLALIVLMIIPLIGGTFFFVLQKMRPLFLKTQGIIDRLNKVINESILGAALVRVINSQQYEYQKFLAINTDAKENGLRILGLFSTLIPFIVFVANLAVVAVLLLGGKAVIGGGMSIGNFTAFNSYIAILIFPIMMIGFMSNVIAQATVSYQRLYSVLAAPVVKKTGTLSTALSGAIAVENVSLQFGEKEALKNISFTIIPGTKNAIIGPTAAGKTQLLYIMTGLLAPTSGTIWYDGNLLHDYDPAAIHRQIGFVFQDSVVFNTTIRENIAFSTDVTEQALQKAIATAELGDLIAELPHGLEEVISERGTNLSGGQKQRLMLARALALNPTILFLDDFTARIDARTEQSIVNNVKNNYPDITLVSITQKVASITDYENIIVMMEGELIAQGTHQALMEQSPEYVQIYQSQQSTDHI